MAMTELALLFIGTLATLATMGLFVNFRDSEGRPDRATEVLVPLLAAVLWGVFGLSSSDVIVRSNSVASSSEPIEPLFWLGVLMAMLVGMYGLWKLFKAIFEESTDNTNMELIP